MGQEQTYDTPNTGIQDSVEILYSIQPDNNYRVSTFKPCNRLGCDSTKAMIYTMPSSLQLWNATTAHCRVGRSYNSHGNTLAGVGVKSFNNSYNSDYISQIPYFPTPPTFRHPAHSSRQPTYSYHNKPLKIKLFTK